MIAGREGKKPPDNCGCRTGDILSTISLNNTAQRREGLYSS